MDPMLISAGVMTGLLVGLTGVGGGALMTPLLLMVFGVAPTTAVGTDLWFAAITKVAATRIHSHHGLIDWQVAKRLWLGSLPASAAVLLSLKFFPAIEKSSCFLSVAVGCAVVLTATALLFQKKLHALGRRLRVGNEKMFKAKQGPLTILSGVVLGVLVTLTSVGSGALGVVFLSYLYPLRLTPPRLIATDIVHAIPLAVFAGLGHSMVGHLNLGLLGNLLVGSVPAVIVGARLSSRLPHGILRRILAVVLFSVGTKLLWSVAECK